MIKAHLTFIIVKIINIDDNESTHDNTNSEDNIHEDNLHTFLVKKYRSDLEPSLTVTLISAC